MKKILSLLVVVGALFMLTACGNKEENLTLKPTEIVAKMYEGFGEDELPMLGDRELVAEELEYHLGITELDFVEGTVSEPMIGSIPHSVVVVKVAEGVDVAKTVAVIKAKANPRKWVCVEAETVLVESKGDIIVLVMSNNDTAVKMMENFKKIK